MTSFPGWPSQPVNVLVVFGGIVLLWGFLHPIYINNIVIPEMKKSVAKAVNEAIAKHKSPNKDDSQSELRMGFLANGTKDFEKYMGEKWSKDEGNKNLAEMMGNILLEKMIREDKKEIYRAIPALVAVRDGRLPFFVYQVEIKQDSQQRIEMTSGEWIEPPSVLSIMDYSDYLVPWKWNELVGKRPSEALTTPKGETQQSSPTK